MSDKARVSDDRRLRDAARGLVRSDWANLRANYAGKGLGERAVNRLSTGAHDVYDEAVNVATDNKGALAAIVAALALWFARNPIIDAVLGEDRK